MNDRIDTEKWWTDDRLERVEPIGTRTSIGFWDGVDEHGRDVGGYGPLELPEYPASPGGERLRQARLRAAYSLREAARWMGLRPVELSSLERGSLRFRDPDDYERVLALLPGARA
jgi:hypothetical protein